ncbi:MAG: bifunctional diaminohydroxyphosphoribosylaminopyrimidine deaminase/5-amino-6-(5-phosphoribosylamino)uracil reductase RibD, partial [Calditrichia bacterium]
MASEHVTYIRQALALAAQAEGYTSPNPMVGAVLVKNGKIIGTGYHQHYGEKHAEINAIENASESVENATLYCNLEPCCHSIPGKKTPPCTNRIIKEKIKKVVISTVDPNPYVNGKGINILRNSGIEVEVGVLAAEAIYLNEVYIKYIQSGKPFVHLKIAQSIDGRIATHFFDSRWITDEAARRVVHRMRKRYSAILVGLNTVKEDNPKLTVRLTEGKQPYRIVLDEKLELPEESSLLTDQYRDKTIIFTTPKHRPETREYLLQKGIRINVVQGNGSGFVDIEQVLKWLSQNGITSLLVEGGSQVYTQFIKQGLFDKISVFIAPIIIGNGIEAIGDL